MVTLASLPVELLQRIVREGRDEDGQDVGLIGLDDEGTLNRGTIKALRASQGLKLAMQALNRRLHAILEPALYHTIVLRSAGSVQIFANTLAASDRLASNVQQLFMVDVTDHGHDWPTDDWTTVILLTLLGFRLPNFRALAIDGTIATSWAQAREDFTRVGLPANVRTFTTGSSDIGLVYASFKQLTYLRMLVEEDSPLAEVLADSYDSLLRLELDMSTHWIQSSFAPLWTNAPRLCNLSIVNVEDHELATLFKAPSSTSLSTLSVVVLDELHFRSGLFVDLPASVSTLALTAANKGFRIYDLSTATSNLRAGCLPNLKTLCLDGWGRPALDEESALRSACAHRKIATTFTWAEEVESPAISGAQRCSLSSDARRRRVGRRVIEASR